MESAKIVIISGAQDSSEGESPSQNKNKIVQYFKNNKKYIIYNLIGWIGLAIIETLLYWWVRGLPIRQVLIDCVLSISLGLTVTTPFAILYNNKKNTFIHILNPNELFIKVITISIILAIVLSFFNVQIDNIFFPTVTKTYDSKLKLYFHSFIFWLRYMVIWVLAFYCHEYYNKLIVGQKKLIIEQEQLYSMLFETNQMLTDKQNSLYERNLQIEKLNQSLSQKNVELKIEKLKAEAAVVKQNEIAESRAKILNSQLDAHFMLNTLNVLKNKISLDPEEASHMLDKICVWLGYALYTNKTVCLKKELEIVDTFISIQKQRFKQMTVFIDVNLLTETDTDLIEIPPLTLQTLVENAIKHGIEPQKGIGNVTLSVQKELTHIIFTITNPGFFDLKRVEEGHGISLSKDLLNRLYGDSASLKHKNNDNIVSTILTIPLN